MPRPPTRPAAMRATPQTSRPWPWSAAAAARRVAGGGAAFVAFFAAVAFFAGGRVEGWRVDGRVATVATTLTVATPTTEPMHGCPNGPDGGERVTDGRFLRDAGGDACGGRGGISHRVGGMRRGYVSGGDRAGTRPRRRGVDHPDHHGGDVPRLEGADPHDRPRHDRVVGALRASVRRGHVRAERLRFERHADDRHVLHQPLA